MKIIEIHLKTVDSTQDYAKKHYLSFDPHQITCIYADEQTKGKGMQQKKWISPKEVNLYATFYFQLPLNISDLTSLAQVLSYSVASVLVAEKLAPKIKWPNDVQINGKKIAGVLCETIFEKDHISIFAGIGVNINMSLEDLLQIDQPATSLKEETKKTWDIKSFLKKLQTQLSKDIDFFKTKGFKYFESEILRINNIGIV
jgi:BirA family biotin operon repressor/biotin-[acetyl-CoA-carboxylase] ligase